MLDESLAANEILSYQPLIAMYRLIQWWISRERKNSLNSVQKSAEHPKNFTYPESRWNRPITTHKRNLSYVANHIFRKPDLLFDYWTTTTLLTMTSAQVVETLPTTID